MTIYKVPYKLTTRINFLMEPKDVEELDIICNNLQQIRSEFVRKAVKKEIDFIKNITK